MNTLLPDIMQTSRQLAARLPANLTEIELGAVLEAGDVLESYIALARAEATKRLKDKQPVDGWELVPTNGKRVIPDVAAAWNRLQPLMDAAVFFGCCSVRIGDLTDAIKAAEGVTEAEAKDLLAEYLKGNLIKGPGGHKLQQKPKELTVGEQGLTSCNREALPDLSVKARAEKYQQREEKIGTEVGHG